MQRDPSVVRLTRIERLTDVVHALVVWRVFSLLPRPDDEDWHWSSVDDFLLEDASTFAVLAIGLAITLVYWNQSHKLLGSLRGSDVRHTALVFLQVFSLLLFLYATRLGVDLGSDRGTRWFESAMAALLGLSAMASWSYAKKDGRLLRPDLPQDEVASTTQTIRAEPLTALLTIPFAFIGSTAWELSWFLYPVVAMIVRGRRRARAGG